MKILILIDQRNWAYDSIATSIIKYNTDDSLTFKIMPVKKNRDNIKKVYHKFDRILLMGWQLFKSVRFIPLGRTVVGIHGHHAWDDKATTPDTDVSPPSDLIDTLNKFLAVNTVSERLFNLFKDHGVKRIVYTPNGVDSSLFLPQNTFDPNQFVVGYSGSKKHDWRKGSQSFILPAVQKAKADIKIAMTKTSSYVPLSEMPVFYHDLDCYVCASSSEGFSLSVLEAASCGLPIISTRVGGCTELIDDGEDGFLVDRDVNAISEKISILKNDITLRKKFSENMRNKIEREYDWSYQVTAWLDFIRG